MIALPLFLVGGGALVYREIKAYRERAAIRGAVTKASDYARSLLPRGWL